MTGCEAIEAIVRDMDKKDQLSAADAMRDFLRREGDFVCETTDALRSEALEHTDLVKPGNGEV